MLTFRKRQFRTYIKALTVLMCGLYILPPSYAEPVHHTSSTLRAPLNKEPVKLIVSTLCSAIPMALEDFSKNEPGEKLTSIDQILPKGWLDSIEKEHKIMVQLEAGDIYISTEPNNEEGGILIRIDASTGKILDSEGIDDILQTSELQDEPWEKTESGIPSTVHSVRSSLWSSQTSLPKFFNRLIAFPLALLLFANPSLATIQPTKTQVQQSAKPGPIDLSLGEPREIPIETNDVVNIQSVRDQMGQDGRIEATGLGLTSFIVSATVGTIPYKEGEMIKKIIVKDTESGYFIDLTRYPQKDRKAQNGIGEGALFPYNLATDYIVGATDVSETIDTDIQTPLRLRLQGTREAERSI